MPATLPTTRAAAPLQSSWLGGAGDGAAQNRDARGGRPPPFPTVAASIGSPFRSRDGAGDVSSLSPIHRLGARAASAAAADADTPASIVPVASASVTDLSDKAVGAGELSDNTYSDFDDDGSDPDSLESGRNSRSASLRIAPSPLSRPQELRAADDVALVAKIHNNDGRTGRGSSAADGVAGGSILMFMSQSSAVSGKGDASGRGVAAAAAAGGDPAPQVAASSVGSPARAAPALLPGSVRGAEGGGAEGDADSDDHGADDGGGDYGADDAPISGGFSPRESAVAYEAPTHINRDLSADDRTRVFFETMREQKRLEEEAKAADVAAKVARLDPAERAAYEAKVAADAQYAQKKDKVITKQLTAFGSGRNVLLAGRGRGRGRGK